MGKPLRKGRRDEGDQGDRAVDPTDPKQLFVLLKSKNGWLAMVLISTGLLIALIAAVCATFFLFDQKTGAVALVFALLGGAYVLLRRVAVNRFNGLMGFDSVDLLKTVDEMFQLLGVENMDAARKKLKDLSEDSAGLKEILAALERKKTASAVTRAKELALLAPKATLLGQIVTLFELKDDSTLLAEVKKARTGFGHLGQLLTLLGVSKFDEAKAKVGRLPSESALLAERTEAARVLKLAQETLQRETAAHGTTRDERDGFKEQARVAHEELAALRSQPPIVVREVKVVESQPQVVLPVVGPFFEGLSDEEARIRLGAYPQLLTEVQELRPKAGRVAEVELSMTRLQLSRDAQRRHLEAQAVLPWNMLKALGVVKGSEEARLDELQALLNPRSALVMSAGNAELHRGARVLRREVERLIAVHCISAQLVAAGEWERLGKLLAPFCRRSAYGQVLPRLDTSVQVWFNDNTPFPKPE